MAHAPEATAPDLAAIKARQQQTWAGGDYAAVASRIVVVAERLVDAADLQAGWHVLDVASGTRQRRDRSGAPRLHGRRASTTSRPCSSAAAGARPPRA